MFKKPESPVSPPFPAPQHNCCCLYTIFCRFLTHIYSSTSFRILQNRNNLSTPIYFIPTSICNVRSFRLYPDDDSAASGWRELWNLVLFYIHQLTTHWRKNIWQMLENDPAWKAACCGGVQPTTHTVLTSTPLVNWPDVTCSLWDYCLKAKHRQHP